MDYNAGLWTFDLDSYIEKFIADELHFVGLKWTSDDSKDYYSVLISPCGYSVIELIGDTVSDKYVDNFAKVDHLRFSFKSKNNKPTTSDKYLTPIKISRATGRMDRVKKYYTKDIGIDVLVDHKSADGFTETLIVMYDQPAIGVHIHFVSNRTAD